MMKKQVVCLFALLLVLSPAAFAADQWVQVTSPHFTLITNGSERDGRKAVDQFERMRWVFQTLFQTSNVDPAVPIVIVGAKDEKTMDGLIPAAYLAKNSAKLAGLFAHSTDKNYILVRLDSVDNDEQNPFATVYHEYTHLQFAASDDWMPLWLNEGTAEFFQNTKFRGKDVRLGQASLDDIYYLRSHLPIPLSVLLAVDHNSPYYHQEDKTSVFYSESWALMHYLMIRDRQNHTNRIGDYEKLVMNHVDPVTAGEKAFGDLKQLQNNLDNYIRQAMYMEFVLNTAVAPIDESTYRVTPVPQTEADARRADVLASVQRNDEARALDEAVLKTDPSNAQANETLGSLAFRAGKLDEARKWYGEAAKLGSQDFLTYFYFAQFSMGKSMSDGDGSVESSLKKAIELNPQFAASYDRLAAYYAMKHEQLDEARRLGLRAIQLEPGNINFRVNAASVLTEMQKYDDAIRVLKAAAGLAKSSGDVEMMQNRIDEIGRFEQAQKTNEAAVEAALKPGTQGGMVDIVALPGPAHPTVTTVAKAHGFDGVIHNVKCSNPYVIEFQVEGVGKSVQVYNNNFPTIDLSAAGFTPPDSMNPCKDFEGMKAQVQYVESPDKTVDGQVTAVELKK